jgi:hypothetical protein
MTQNDGSLEVSKRALEIKEAIRQSVAKRWVKERYSPPSGEPPSQLRDLVSRLEESR